MHVIPKIRSEPNGPEQHAFGFGAHHGGQALAGSHDQKFKADFGPLFRGVNSNKLRSEKCLTRSRFFGKQSLLLKTNSMKKNLSCTFFLIALLLAGSNVTAPALGLNTAGAQVESEAQELDEAVNVDENENETLDAVEEQEAANTAGNAAAAAAASQGTIYVGPSASGDALRILSQGYTLVPLTGGPISGPVVVGAGDLFVPWIGDQLVAAYEQGHAVALTNATTFGIRQLHDLLGHRGSAEPVPGGATVELAAFRKAFRADGQLHSSVHLLLQRVVEPPAGPLLTSRDKKRIKRLHNKGLREKLRNKLVKLRRQQQEQARQQRLQTADASDIQALSRIFSATPFVPEPPPGDTPNNLIELAESYMSQAIQTDYYGNQVQIVNSVWAARSFLNSADLYYVLQETDYHVVPKVTNPANNLPYVLTIWNNSVNSFITDPARPATLLQPSPQTTMEATQDISSVSHTIGVDVGWNQTQGLNASVSDSITVMNEKVTTIPPINITNNANLGNGNTQWLYNVNELPSQSETIDLFSQWIWSVPFSNYFDSQTEFQYHSDAFMSGTYCGFDGFNPPLCLKFFLLNVSAHVTASVPLPFGRTFALQQPAVTSVNPTTVNAGDTFAINGTGFYPNLVQAVLIGGTAVDQANVTTVSDTQINVVAPDFVTCEFGCTVVVQTTQGASNDNVTISIIPNP